MYQRKMTVKEEMAINLNNKKIKDLNHNLKLFINEIFSGVNQNEYIRCDIKNGSKIDLTIHYKNQTRNISLFQDGVCLVYQNRVKKFVGYLLSIGVSIDSILAILTYHYADGTYDGSGVCNVLGEELSMVYAKEVQKVCDELKNEAILSKIIDHILIYEASGDSVDYFYVGDVRRGIYSSKEHVKKKMLLLEDNYQHKFMRIGNFNYMPAKRTSYYSEKNESKKHICTLKLNISKYIKKQGKNPL